MYGVGRVGRVGWVVIVCVSTSIEEVSSGDVEWWGAMGCSEGVVGFYAGAGGFSKGWWGEVGWGLVECYAGI